MTLAVSERSGLRGKLTRVLKSVKLEVDNVAEEEIRRLVKNRSGRILIIDRASLPDDPAQFIEELLCEEDAPALVVVEDGDDPLDRARILASGATRVVDGGEAEKDLTLEFEALTSVEPGHGAPGPEIRGNTAQPRLIDFLSRSRSMRRFVSSVEKVADADCSLLITGETGVGKERLARAIHVESGRPGEFVGVNCGALSESLLESHLFGHAAGSFTGARGRHRGFFEQATGGTVFLDEVGEIPMHLQVKLLTVLQRHEVHPLGDENPVKVDVRVVAATNRDLRSEIAAGRFREDLYYRLNVINLQIPPLRNRPEDIPDLTGALIQFFRCDMAKTNVKTISENAMQAMVDYSWPGNIRELINVVERSMILSEGPNIELADLPADMTLSVAGVEIDPFRQAAPTSDTLESKSLKEVREQAAARAERAYLDQALQRHQGRLNEVAHLAKIGPRSLYEKMQRYGLRKEDYRKGEPSRPS